MCPGREATTEYAMGDEWTPCNPQQGAITVNIGDALMYWSDDKLKVHVSQAGCTPSLDADVTCIVTNSIDGCHQKIIEEFVLFIIRGFSE